MAKDNTLSFDNILVNFINTNSGIFVGTNSQSNWNSHSNNKSGFGEVTGNGNIISRGVHVFMDNDLIDTPIISNSFNGMEQLNPKGAEDNIKIYGRRVSKHNCCSSR